MTIGDVAAELPVVPLHRRRERVAESAAAIVDSRANDDAGNDQRHDLDVGARMLEEVGDGFEAVLAVVRGPSLTASPAGSAATSSSRSGDTAISPSGARQRRYESKII